MHVWKWPLLEVAFARSIRATLLLAGAAHASFLGAPVLGQSSLSDGPIVSLGRSPEEWAPARLPTIQPSPFPSTRCGAARPQMSIVEIREYTLRPEVLSRYERWTRELVVPWLRSNFDVVGFYVECGIEPEVPGSASPPLDGQPPPSACLMIRWPSKEARDTEFRGKLATPEWRDIWAKHPCPDAYLEKRVRFMKVAD